MTPPLAPRRLAALMLLWVMLAGVLAPAGRPAPAAAENDVFVPPRGLAATPAPADDWLVVRVYFRDRAERDRLASELDAVETSTLGGYVTALASPAEHAALVSAGYRVEVDTVQTALVNQRLPTVPDQPGSIPGYACYRTVEETYADLAALAASHPGLAEWLDIGDS
jgi:hypothetical protein